MDEAVNGLPSGLYIIGGKKVAIKQLSEENLMSLFLKTERNTLYEEQLFMVIVFNFVAIFSFCTGA